MSGFDIAWGWIQDSLAAVVNTEAGLTYTCALAVVFGWSGVSKIRRPGLSAMTLVDFGVARRVRPAHGTALGAAELMLAAALIAGAAYGGWPAQAANLAALIVLASFTAAIAKSLSEGNATPCACFGGTQAPLSRASLARTGALMLVAIVSVALGWNREPVAAPSDAIFAAVSGLAVVAVTVLTVHIKHLLGWNSDPFGTDDALWETRGG
jgi:hypothetical protein